MWASRRVLLLPRERSWGGSEGPTPGGWGSSCVGWEDLPRLVGPEVVDGDPPRPRGPTVDGLGVVGWTGSTRPGRTPHRDNYRLHSVVPVGTAVTVDSTRPGRFEIPQCRGRGRRRETGVGWWKGSSENGPGGKDPGAPRLVGRLRSSGERSCPTQTLYLGVHLGLRLDRRDRESELRPYSSRWESPVGPRVLSGDGPDGKGWRTSELPFSSPTRSTPQDLNPETGTFRLREGRWLTHRRRDPSPTLGTPSTLRPARTPTSDPFQRDVGRPLRRSTQGHYYGPGLRTSTRAVKGLSLVDPGTGRAGREPGKAKLEGC